MNLLSLSDLHADGSRPFSRPLPNGRPSRFQHLLDVLAQVETYLDTHRVTDLVLAGDLTHRRHFISWKLYNPLWDALERLSSRVHRTHIIPGNHDYEDEQTHSLHVLDGLAGDAIVFDAPAMTKLHSGELVAMLPYLHDPERIRAAVDSFPRECPLIGHYGTEGVPLETDYWLDSPLKLGEVARFPWTLFGHIHKPSTLLDGRVIYQGAVMPFDFGDSGTRGMVHVTDDGPTFVPLASPQFITTKYPKMPVPPAVGGYLRVLDAPEGRSTELTERARACGWLDAVVLTAKEMVAEVELAMARGLVVDEAMLSEYLKRKFPQLSEEEHVETVAEGYGLLLRARKR